MALRRRSARRIESSGESNACRFPILSCLTTDWAATLLDGSRSSYRDRYFRWSEVYVQPFPPTGAQFQITNNGGSNPLWSPDGKQLFYLTLGTKRQIMSVEVQTPHAFAFGRTTPLPIEVI